MKIPQLSHTQALVLRLIESGATTSIALQERLRRHGAVPTNPAFVQLMSRMVEGGLITESVIRSGKSRREYSVTRQGANLLQETVRFYGVTRGERRAA